MAKHSSKKERKSPNKFFVIITALIICAGALYAAYYFTLNKADGEYVNNLYEYKVKIDKTNKDAVDSLKLIDGAEIKDTDRVSQFRDIISKCESSMASISTGLKSIKSPARYSIQFENYIKGVEANKKIYSQINAMLKNPKSSDLSSAQDALENFIIDAKKYYDASNLKKASVKLPDEFDKLINSTYTYTSKVYQEFQSKSTLIEQYSVYFGNMDNVIYSFNTIKTDLNQNYVMLQNNQIKVSNIYTAVEKKLIELSGIQDLYNELSIPAKLGKQHKKLNEILKAYTYYCQDFKNAVTKYEEASPEGDDMTEVEKLFTSLEGKYIEIDNEFTQYMDTYNKNKDFYSDPNNI